VRWIRAEETKRRKWWKCPEAAAQRGKKKGKGKGKGKEGHARV
jgi:hypothetical protein